jgi:hypothetical protein
MILSNYRIAHNEQATKQGDAHMNYYTTRLLTNKQAQAFSREAYENIGTELDIDEWEDGDYTVTVFEVETEREKQILRRLENDICAQ